MVGVEIVDPERPDATGVPEPDGALAARIQRAMLDRKVIVELGGRSDAVVRFLPPLIVEPAHVDRIVEAFAAALAASPTSINAINPNAINPRATNPNTIDPDVAATTSTRTTTVPGKDG
jgi:hypothetical protein